jgi:hypothetical protein
MAEPRAGPDSIPPVNRTPRMILLVLNGILALTAIGGGSALALGYQTPPVALLQGSPFASYLIPGVALIVLVGGSAGLAFVTLAFRRRSAFLANLAAAAAVVIFEIVEIGIVGSPQGPARTMQILYLSIGALIAATAIFGRGETHSQ